MPQKKQGGSVSRVLYNLTQDRIVLGDFVHEIHNSPVKQLSTIALLGCICPTCCCVHRPGGTSTSHCLGVNPGNSSLASGLVHRSTALLLEEPLELPFL